MLKIRLFPFFYILVILLPIISANFDVKLSHCQFKCIFGVCEAKTEEKNDEIKTKIPGYFWRDFNGIIPDDAFPVGNATQSPRTFIGYTFVPETSTTVVVTIVEGLDYVYAVRNGYVKKVTKNIQILCTQEPDKLHWIHLTKENRSTLKNILFILGGAYFNNNTKKVVDEYIARAPSCNINYAGSISSGSTPLQIALIDGSLKNESLSEFLYYQKGSSNNNETDGKKEKDKKKKKKSSSFFKYDFEYSINPTSIIPNFYKYLKAGPCSITCTNQDKKNKKNDPSMDYFWMPDEFFSKNYGLEISTNAFGKTLYIGQTYVNGVGLDVGYFDGSIVMLTNRGTGVVSSSEYKVFGTMSPEKFKWIDANSTQTSIVDENILIPGGALLNGTQTMVGKVNDSSSVIPVITPASVRITDDGLYAVFYNFVPDISEHFQLLSHIPNPK